MQNQFLTANEVAELFKLNVETVYDMAGQGELPAVKIRGRWRFDSAELREWFRNQGSTTARAETEKKGQRQT